ncbi:hypothetical protein [Sphingomonas sp. PR090111-T3T-6A]|uniref:hypothetical protein n=1 Tax=Sphingomonas sp. PR090111-T3T-6A TaxID=685778 RepID=UPI001F3F6A58
MNAVSAAVSVAIIYFAFRDWPARYASHSLSWSVVAFFLAFVSLSIAGVIATALYAHRKRETLLRVAAAPAVLLGAGFALGVLKAALTGDF